MKIEIKNLEYDILVCYNEEKSKEDTYEKRKKDQ